MPFLDRKRLFNSWGAAMGVRQYCFSNPRWMVQYRKFRLCQSFAINNDPFGIIALVIYHPPDVCLGPCPPNTFYLKINSKSPAYLRGYNICDDDSCTKRDDLSVLLPITDILKPNFKMIPLPEDLRWKYGDSVHIQLEVSPISDTKTILLIDHGNSTIVS